MGKSYAMYKDPDGKSYKMTPSLEIFNKKTEQFIKEIPLKHIDYEDLKIFMINDVQAFPDEPFIGSVDVTPVIGRFLIKTGALKELNFKKNIYQLSFDNVEYISEKEGSSL